MLRKVVVAAGLGLLPIVATLPATPASATQGASAAKIEVAVMPPQTAQGGTVTVAGRLTTADGAPVVDAQTLFWWSSNSRVEAPLLCAAAQAGVKQVVPQPAPCKTDAKGQYSVEVALDDPGAHRFVAEYVPVDGGESLRAETVAWSLPPQSKLKPDGELTSTKGVVFPPGVRKTTISGGGYDPQAPVAIVGYLKNDSDGGVLATTTASAEGDFEVDVVLPEDYSGEYTLASLGAVQQAAAQRRTAVSQKTTVLRTLTLPITVMSPPPAAPKPTSTDPLTSSAGTTFSPSSLATKVSGSGFAPGTGVSILVYSAPVLLGTGTVDSNGGFEVAVNLPSSLSVGDHTLVAMGQGTDSVARILTEEITMAAPAPAPTESTWSTSSTSSWTTTTSTTLPVTGGSSTPAIATVGLLLLVSGAGLYIAARRRRISFTS